MEANLNTEIYWDKKCEMCGKDFRARGNRAKYCPACRPLAAKERDKMRTLNRQEYAFVEKTEVKRNMKVVEAARKCKELGISYGEAVARGLV